jgi:hypothetical protein
MERGPFRRRRSERVPWSAQAVYRRGADHREERCTIEDVSLLGALLATSQLLEPGTEIVITQILDPAASALRLSGVVLRSDARSDPASNRFFSALSFRPMPLNVRAQLQQLIDGKRSD